MLQRILVPLDGSARAEYALPVAARLARTAGGTLILLRVYQVMPSEFVLSDYAAEAAPATAYLAQVAERPELAGITIETIALAGAVALTILDAVQAYRADTIVLYSHGRSGPTRWALGSVAEKVVRHASVPVLVLREPAGPPLDLQLATSHPLHALVALDGSSLAEAALAPAAQMIQALAAPKPGALHLVRVVQPCASADDEQAAFLDRVSSLQEQTLRHAQDYLRAVVERVRSGDLGSLKLKLTWSVVIAEDVAATLVQLAEGVTAPLIQLAEGGEDTEESNHAHIALIVLASHGRGGVQRWTLGSIAERVLTGTQMPLLIVRPSRNAAHQPSP
jgi:nucleotide-binding universal stress UspA family protein